MTNKNIDIETLNPLKAEINALYSALSCVNINSPHADLYKSMITKKKEDYVLSVHKTKIQEQKGVRPNGKEYMIYATRPNGEKKYVKCATYDGLIDKLYAIYARSGDMLTLEAVYQQASNWKAQGGAVKMATLKRYQTSWDKFFSCYPIAKNAINSISLKEWQDHFEMLCRTLSLTKKQFNAVRDVVSMVMAYAIKNGMVSYNCTRDVSYKELPYKKSSAYNSILAKPFTEAEAGKVIEWCYDQLKNRRVSAAYLWAIILNLRMGLRYAELHGLKWEDINFSERTITVKDQMVLDYDEELNCIGFEMAGHCKGYEEARTLPMPDDVKEAFMQIKALGLSDEYVFPDGHFRYNTLNKKIKECAESIGLNRNNYSTHSLRATAATVLYMHTKDLYQVQTLLGHTTPQMTMKYIKNLMKEETLRKTMLSDDWQSLRTSADHLKAS